MKNYKSRFRYIVLVSGLLAFLSTGCLGQSYKSLATAIEPQRRSLFIRSVKRVVSLQKARKWARLATILSPEFLQGETPAEYIARLESLEGRPVFENGFREFTPREIKNEYRAPNYEIWLIDGCGKWRVDAKPIWQKAYIRAYWQNDKWLFSEVVFDLLLHGGYEKCPESQSAKVATMLRRK
ncbi:MAG: hypothetical protein IPJ30_19140 [Acidobacteria bacterium]|nr:hypothetical protein [Acidobacteriota bacterium]